MRETFHDPVLTALPLDLFLDLSLPADVGAMTERPPSASKRQRNPPRFNDARRSVPFLPCELEGEGTAVPLFCICDAGDLFQKLRPSPRDNQLRRLRVHKLRRGGISEEGRKTGVHKRKAAILHDRNCACLSFNDPPVGRLRFAHGPDRIVAGSHVDERHEPRVLPFPHSGRGGDQNLHVFLLRRENIEFLPGGIRIASGQLPEEVPALLSQEIAKRCPIPGARHPGKEEPEPGVGIHQLLPDKDRLRHGGSVCQRPHPRLFLPELLRLPPFIRHIAQDHHGPVAPEHRRRHGGGNNATALPAQVDFAFHFSPPGERREHSKGRSVVSRVDQNFQRESAERIRVMPQHLARPRIRSDVAPLQTEQDDSLMGLPEHLAIGFLKEIHDGTACVLRCREKHRRAERKVGIGQVDRSGEEEIRGENAAGGQELAREGPAPKAYLRKKTCGVLRPQEQITIQGGILQNPENAEPFARRPDIPAEPGKLRRFSDPGVEGRREINKKEFSSGFCRNRLADGSKCGSDRLCGRRIACEYFRIQSDSQSTSQRGSRFGGRSCKHKLLPLLQQPANF